jgi:hypothetical protein
MVEKSKTPPKPITKSPEPPPLRPDPEFIRGKIDPPTKK